MLTVDWQVHLEVLEHEYTLARMCSDIATMYYLTKRIRDVKIVRLPVVQTKKASASVLAPDN
jgi:hypothetical protein